MNIVQPQITSSGYKSFLALINNKIGIAMDWLYSRGINYILDFYLDGHLYRMYIPKKDVLLDFECYPVINDMHNYIRVNYDTDIIQVLERLFPETVLDTDELDIWVLKQIKINKFLRENGSSPVYDKNVLRLAWVKDDVVYQCMVLQGNKVIRNVTKHNHSIKFGTYMLLRYINEGYGVEDIEIPETLDNSFSNMLYQMLGLPYRKSIKRKILWSPNRVLWRSNDLNNYIPFYLCEKVTYTYTGTKVTNQLRYLLHRDNLQQSHQYLQQ